MKIISVKEWMGASTIEKLNMVSKPDDFLVSNKAMRCMDEYYVRELRSCLLTNIDTLKHFETDQFNINMLRKSIGHNAGELEKEGDLESFLEHYPLHALVVKECREYYATHKEQ
jgi:hypothetical protein